MTQDKGRKLLRNVKNYCGLISATLSIDKFRMLLRKSLLVLLIIFSHANAWVFQSRIHFFASNEHWRSKPKEQMMI